MIPANLVAYLPYALYGLVGVFFVLGGLVGFLRGTKKATIKLGMALVRAVICILLVIVLLPWLWDSMLGDTIMPYIDSALADNEMVRELFSASPALLDVKDHAALALVGPIVFLLAYIALGIVFWILFLILGLFAKIGRRGKQKKSFLNRCGGFTIGGIKSLVFCFVLLVPICGLLTIANSAFLSVQGDDGSMPEILSSVNVSIVGNTAPEGEPSNEILLSDLVADLAEHPVSSTVNAIGGNALFSTLTRFPMTVGTTEAGEPIKENVQLAHELTVLIHAFGAFSPLTESDIADYGDAQVESIHTLADTLCDSKLITAVASELLSTACKQWDAGNTFLGAEPPQTGDATMDMLLSDLFNAFQQCTPDTIDEDFTTIADLFEVFIKYDALDVFFAEDEENAPDLMDVFATEGMVTETMTVLHANPHTAPLCVTIANLGITAICEDLNLPETVDSIYDALMLDIAAALNSTVGNADRNAALLPLLRDAFAEHGYEITEDLLSSVSFALSENFQAATDATAVKAFFLAQSTGQPQTLSASKTIANVWSELSSPSQFITKLPTKASVTVSRDAIANVIDMASEAASLEEAFAKMLVFRVSLVGGMSSPEDILAFDLEALGTFFDLVSDTALYGPVSAPLLYALLDMDSIRALDIITPAVRETLIEALNDPNASLADVFKTAQLTASLAMKIKNGDSTADTIKGMIGNITPSSAGYIRDILTADFAKAYGLGEKQAASVSKSIGGILMGIANTEHMTEAESEKESAAIEDLLIISGKVEHDAPLFGSDLSAEHFIGSMMGSTVVTNGILNDPENQHDFSTKLVENPSDKLAVRSALAKYSEDHELSGNDLTDAQQAEKKKLDALAGMFGFAADPENGYTFSSGTTSSDIGSSSFTAKVTGSYTYDPDGYARPDKNHIQITDNSNPANPFVLTEDCFKIVGYEYSDRAGTATVVVSGTGYYTGTMRINYTIAPISISNMSGSVSGTYTYMGDSVDVSGSAIHILCGSEELVFGTDFTIDNITGNDAPGTAQITLRGCGNFTGTLTLDFTID